MRIPEHSGIGVGPARHGLIGIAVIALVTALAACGGDDNDDATPMPPESVNLVPPTATESSSSFIAFLRSLMGNDETSSPKPLGRISPLNDETSAPTDI